MDLDFNTFLTKVQQGKPRPGGRFVGRLLALDPGETTGWSVWDSHDNAIRYELSASGQLETWDKSNNSIHPCVANFDAGLLNVYEPNVIVMESYHIYSWHSEDHKWSEVPTLRIIGSMETRIIDRHIPYYFQTAQVAKQFVTDDLLKSWGFYKRGERHARDSMRHGLYFILFGPQGKQTVLNRSP